MIKATNDLLKSLSAEASTSVRKRKNHNFHSEESDPLQRMLNAVEPGSYVRPHKHINPDKREVFIILKGSMAIVEFDDKGAISDHIVLDAAKGNYAAEIIPASWHTVISLKEGSVYYEIKDGPYDPVTDKVFADWSPEEGSEDAGKFMNETLEKIL
ncbi:MAG: WbuC family cupin fold metalloprotein [Bacteroidales bacterium]|jgi:cupin fold WbuC family metalloprotein